MSFNRNLSNLVGQLDEEAWPDEVRTLQRCRNQRELDALASKGWISSSPRDPRLKLVKHGSGTYLVVKYEDGWSTTMAQQPFR